MVVILLISCMYLKLTILLLNWKGDSKKMNITFARNSQNIAHTISFLNISLADRIGKVCQTNAANKKLKEIKLKLYKNLKAL